MRVRNLIAILQDFHPDDVVLIESTGGNLPAVIPDFVVDHGATELVCGDQTTITNVCRISGDGSYGMEA